MTQATALAHVLTPTPEQVAIIDVARAPGPSLMVNAHPGTGKTTTLSLLAKAIPSPGLALAFNVRIKDELATRLAGTPWQVWSFNGLGHRAWGKAIGRRCEVDDRKLGKIVSALVKGRPKDDWDAVRQLISKAMQVGLVPSDYPHRSLVPDTREAWANLAESLWLDPNQDLLGLARTGLIMSIRQGFAGVITYDEQIYLSTCLGGVFPRFETVLVDERQDLSTLNITQLGRVAAGRIIAVGDDNQAIYQWRGADSDATARIRALRPEWLDLPLAVSFRCPRVIVAACQAFAPGFRAAPTNREGRILDAYRRTPSDWAEEWGTLAEGDRSRTWTWADVTALGFTDIAILSRNNAQVITMAFRLLGRGVACQVVGREIGKGLINLSRQILKSDSAPRAECEAAILAWQESQVGLAQANGHLEKVAGIVDRAESLLAVLRGSAAPTAMALRTNLESLFARKSGLNLSTIHRFKGLEADLVIWLDPWRVPSRYAQKAAADGDPVPLQQEHNLAHIARTRTRDTLILANLEDFR